VKFLICEPACNITTNWSIGVATHLSAGEQRIVPYLSYSNTPAAIEFLCAAFGFEERCRVPMPDGRIGHAEVAFQGHIVMLASAYKEMGFVSPKMLPAIHSQIVLLVDDVDAHYERALAAGATIATAPKDQHGQRMYRAMDPEGHRWIFSMPLTDPTDDDEAIS
jgi:PhnB protein